MAREREGVLAHLAVCAECREIVSVAAAAGPEQVARREAESFAAPPRLTQGTRSPRRSWFPWAAVAACLIAILGAVLMHRERRLPSQPGADIHASLSAAIENPTAMIAASKQAEDAPATSAPVPAAGPTAASEARRKTTRPSTNTGTGHGQGRATSGAQPQAARSAAVPAPAMETEMVTVEGDLATTAAAPQAEVVPEPSEKASGAAKAKHGTALAGALGGLRMSRAMAAPLRSRWRINDLGQLERALGEGDWKAVLTDENAHLRTVSVVGTEVWAGGAGPRLYHSPDDGQTWSQVPLPPKKGADSIEHIRFDTPENGTIDANNGTAWTTSDGGKTWE